MNEKDKYGWICPKCGTVHAPWVSSCLCSTKVVPFPRPRAFPSLPNFVTCKHDR